MQKTLGGDRLGGGKKMKVDLHGYERSTHDLGYIWRSSMAAGTLVPFICELGLPGDTYDIDLQGVILTHPTVGPLFSSFKAQFDIFLCPIRLYNSGLHNNLYNIGTNVQNIKFPVLRLTAPPTPAQVDDLDNLQINPSSILSYLGIRGIGVNGTESNQTRDFNAIPLLAYWEIYLNYYANKQEEIGTYIVSLDTENQTVDVVTFAGIAIPETTGDAGAIFSNSSPAPTITYTSGTAPDPNQILLNTAERGLIPASAVVNRWFDDGVNTLTGSGGSIIGIITINAWQYADVNSGIQISDFDLANINQMRTDILANPYNAAMIIDSAFYAPYGQAVLTGGQLGSQAGLALKTYQSDLFNNWLDTTAIDDINTRSSIDTTAGNFTIDTMIMARKVYDYLNRVQVSGGSYQDWLDVSYDEERFTTAEEPMYMGGLSKEVIFQAVVSMANAEQQPLGTLAGRGTMSNKHKGGKTIIKVKEPSIIMGIVSLTPRIDYSQGNKWDTHLTSIGDLHVPALDQIGFQDLITEQMAWWDTHWDDTTMAWIQNSAGKQPAWTNYMTNVNKTYGNFAIQNNEMFMTLNRRYEPSEAKLIQDLTTYIDPSKYNYIFAQTSLDSQNFWTQIAVDMIVRRKMSAKIMPNL